MKNSTLIRKASRNGGIAVNGLVCLEILGSTLGHHKGQLATLEKLTRPNIAFLTVAASYNHQQLSLVHEWFAQRLQPWIGIADHITPATPRQMSEYIIANSPDLQLPMSQLLRLADLGINGLSVREEGPLSLSQSTNQAIQQSIPQQVRRYLELEHRGSGGSQRFALSDESLGTQQLLTIGTYVLLGLRIGSVLVVDELDASLHPQLVRALVELFYRDNPNDAQLIFNTHDATLLSGDLFRRDQVWFVEKDPEGASHLYPLLDFSPRKDESLERGYLRGRYGAVPFIEREDWHGLISHAAS
ncbi:MAG: ATP-binding protein [Thermomicrobiales bacterium]